MLIVGRKVDMCSKYFLNNWQRQWNPVIQDDSATDRLHLNFGRNEIIDINDIMEYRFKVLLKVFNAIEIVIVKTVLNKINDVDDEGIVFWYDHDIKKTLEWQSSSFLLHLEAYW